MLAACGAEGDTVICNAAREPEIADLQEFLCAMGVQVRGAGGSVITVSPGRALHGCAHRVIPDRIVTATYLCAAAAAGGDITLRNTEHRQLAAVTTALRQAGCRVDCGADYIRLTRTEPLRAVPPGLAAEGVTTVQGVGHIHRGYEELPAHLRALGAHITEEN